MKESYPFTDEFPNWAEMSEDERIEQIHYYFDGMIEEEGENLLSENQSEARSEQGHNEYSALNEAAEIQTLKRLKKRQKNGIPTGIRTPVAGMKTRCPRPLDDRDAVYSSYLEYVT